MFALMMLQSALQPKRPYSGNSNGASHRPSPHCGSTHDVVTTLSIQFSTSFLPPIVVAAGMNAAVSVDVSEYASSAFRCMKRMLR